MNARALPAVRAQRCPACGPSLFVRLAPSEMQVRCLRCRASPVTLSLIAVLRECVPDLGAQHCFEMSSRGALVRYLRRHARELTVSEYFDDVAPGSMRDGVQCQDVMRLTFAPERFDLCTSTEVFEHVPDDLRGFREVHRVLKPGGWFVFTVPLVDGPTVERAVQGEDGIVHRMPPEYHSDRLRGRGRVLCFRNYGADVVERLRDGGFAWTEIRMPARPWWGFARGVVLARKGDQART